MGRCANFLEDASRVDWSKSAYEDRSVAFRSVGGSLATLTEDCMMPSGTVCMSGRGGGSADRNARKSSCPSAAISSLRSRVGSHDCMRWIFCRNTQPPSRVKRSSVFSACFSWPWPMEIGTKLPRSSVKPSLRPRASSCAPGSTPGNRTKKSGRDLEESLNASSIEKASCCMYRTPRRSSTKLAIAVVTRSERRALRSRIFWNGVQRLSHSPGSSTSSGRSASSHSRQASVASSRSSGSVRKASTSLRAQAAAHCRSERYSCTRAVMCGGVSAFLPMMRYSPSTGSSSPSRRMMASNSCVARMSLWRSKRPRRA
mmetsp:Transcript_14864/g.36124  ORF Transcript_14864/g.36124 Transcript_14864/m.36124 type:complete len:314 (-) Transcript_14864:1673-2614(-)